MLQRHVERLLWAGLVNASAISIDIIRKIPGGIPAKACSLDANLTIM